MKSLASELEGGLTLNDARMNPNYPLIPQRFISIIPIKPPSPKHHLAPPPLPFLPSSTQPIYTTPPPHSHTMHHHHNPPPQPHLLNNTSQRETTSHIGVTKTWSDHTAPHPTTHTTHTAQSCPHLRPTAPNTHSFVNYTH